MDEVKSFSELIIYLENDNIINYLSENYAYDYSKICKICGKEGKIQNHPHYPDKICFSCCRKKWSIRRATVFSKMKISMRQFFLIMFCYVFDFSNQITCKEAEVSEITYIKFKKLFREICNFVLDRGK